MSDMFSDPFFWFWSAMIFGSIAWYGYLLFHVGWRGGRDIVHMSQALAEAAAREDAGRE